MQDVEAVTGIVLKSIPVGEYDRAVTILTKEKGKISAFAKGARKLNNRFMASTEQFCFGSFKLFRGRNAYTLTEASISNYFGEFREDMSNCYMGMYFLEVMDYFTREGGDLSAYLKLLYQSLRALLHKGLENRLVRLVFEMKTMVLEGEFPGVPQREPEISSSCAKCISFVMTTPPEKLFTFILDEKTLAETMAIMDDYKKRLWDHHFKSLEMLEFMDLI